MNILKLLSANETATVTAGAIYWARHANGQRRYFVPGSDYEYTTYEGASRAARREGIGTRLRQRQTILAARTAAWDEYRNRILPARGQTLITHFFPSSQ